MGDIQVIGNETVFNYRVSGAVIKDSKIMLNRLKNDDFWTFVGGKVAFGESSEKAIIREYYEETGANVEVERLVACVENFFSFKSKQWHELLFFYVLKDENDELEIKYVTLMCDKEELIRRWKKDDKCEWRTDEWLKVSLKSLPHFMNQESVINTTCLSIPEITEMIIR